MNPNVPSPYSRYAPSRSRDIYRMRREAYRETEPPAAEAEAAVESATDLEPQLREAIEERDRLKDALLRARADMENYRRRVERDREEANAQRGREVILAMLPVLDNFERAIQGAGQATDAASVMAGVEMIRDQFRAALMAQGLEPVEAEGKKFDPSFHEAVAVDEREDVEDNEVVNVLQEGFLLGRRLLRPAMVRVGRKKK